MPVSRRVVLASSIAVAGAGLGAAAVRTALPSHASSPAGDVVGAVTVGYQGWFSCAGDGAPIGGWWHWAPDRGKIPSPANEGIVSWPDVREYDRTYPTGYRDLPDGRRAALFSSYDAQTVDVHVRWMREHDIDTIALQRFNPTGDEGPTRDAVTRLVRDAAERHGRRYYVMYDVSGWRDMRHQITADWTAKMAAQTSSPAYARQNGKPVVGIWGFGFNDDNHPWGAADCLAVIRWFQEQGCYVMGGTPTHWRAGESDSRPGFDAVYRAYDMISPWMVGRIGDSAGSDWFHANVTVKDVAECRAHGIDYQPCVLPGDLGLGQRRHGDFMWRQFWNTVRAGADGLYISMFDEFNEGNQIAKTAETSADVPAGGRFVGLDEDGTACSADYYLRLTRDGRRMLRGELPLTEVRPTPTVPGGPPGSPAAVALRARANGRYVTGAAGTSPLIASAAAAGPAELFRTVEVAGGVALRSVQTGRYVCAENAGAGALLANRASAGPWETFELVRLPGGGVALRAAVNGLFVCAESAGAAPLVANRAAAGGWETFDLVEGG